MRQIIPQGDKYVIAFDYSPHVLADVKLIPGRAWNPVEKQWIVPKSSKQYLERFADKHQFSFSDGEKPAMLRNFDYTIPPMPAMSVEIPLLRDLFPFQREGVQYTINAKRTIIGDKPGLGKTAQAIAAMVYTQAYPALVVCPSTLKENWKREIKMWTGKDAMILNDSIRRTWDYFYDAGMAQIFIVNYESLKKYFVEEINQPIDPKTGKPVPLRLNHIKFSKKVQKFRTVVCDESHRIKDPKTQQAKFVKGICSDKEHIYLISGTPVVNKPNDLISPLGILNRINEFGGYQNFKKNFCETDSNWKELNVLLRRTCFYSREKTDVLKDLPAKIRQSVLCDISTRKEYRDAMADLEDYMKRYRQATDEQIQKSMKGEIMVRIGILKNISARGKIKDVVEYVSDVIDAGEKIILFTHLKEVQQQLKKFFPAAVTIFGEDDMQARQRNIDAFQSDPRVQIIICSIKAAGVGLTLTASSRVAFVELPWHPADCEQCEDRAHRIGQTDSVQCTYFLGNDTIDEHIYKIIADKRDMSNQITGGRNDVEESVLDGVIGLLMNK